MQADGPDAPNLAPFQEVSTASPDGLEPAGAEPSASVEEDTSAYVRSLAPIVSPPRRRRIGLPTATLVLALAAALGFFAGVRAEKAKAGSAASNPAALFASLRAARAGGAGGGGGGSFASQFGGGSVTGQVRLVDGTTIYLVDAQGNITKVTTGPASAFTKSSQASIKDVRPGDTVVVQGQQQPDGTVTATRVGDNGAGGGTRGGGSSGGSAG